MAAIWGSSPDSSSNSTRRCHISISARSTGSVPKSRPFTPLDSSRYLVHGYIMYPQMTTYLAPGAEVSHLQMATDSPSCVPSSSTIIGTFWFGVVYFPPFLCWPLLISISTNV